MLMLNMDPSATLAEYSPSRWRHVMESLLNSDVVQQGSDGSLSLQEDAFKKVLANHAAARPTGVNRFLINDRIDRYPSNMSEREELLRVIASKVIRADELLDEQNLNDRLLTFTDDPAVLRRYLVDFSILERRRDGSEYTLANPAS